MWQVTHRFMGFVSPKNEWNRPSNPPTCLQLFFFPHGYTWRCGHGYAWYVFRFCHFVSSLTGDGGPFRFHNKKTVLRSFPNLLLFSVGPPQLSMYGDMRAAKHLLGMVNTPWRASQRTPAVGVRLIRKLLNCAFRGIFLYVLDSCKTLPNTKSKPPKIGCQMVPP